VLWDNIWIALTLFFFVWIFNWAKGNLGSAKLAIVFAAVIIYLTFYQYPELVWLVVFLFVFSTFGIEIFNKAK